LADERQELNTRCIGAPHKYPRDACVHTWFERQVEKTPNAVGVSFQGRTLAYGELETRANQLAQYLCRIGLSPGCFVALCVERSIEMVVAMLAILKAGAAYVPIEPSQPAERLAFILADAQASLVLALRRSDLKLPPESRVVWLDQDEPAIAREPPCPMPARSTAADVAYLMYTSGSTGQPKGVCIPHRAILRLVVNTDYIELGSSDVVAQAANPAFDAATFEVWGALLNGARLEILSAEVLLVPRVLAKQLQELRITTLWATTAWFNFLAAEQPDIFKPLKQVLFGGEAADPQAARRVLEGGRPQRLLHMYGPTEATTFATWCLVEQVPAGATTVPLGRPIANTEVYLLDQNQGLVREGVPGEIYIGGDGLATCYWKRPELTAERFLNGPFPGAATQRLFRTGDLAQYRTDGTIEFLRRLDDQVKVRGFRVEPKEVEAALRRFPSVREAIVVQRADTSEDLPLVAYVVPESGATLDSGSLREHACRCLPHYMVPSFFVVLSRLPLTANGKVDRKNLPAPPKSAVSETSTTPSPGTLLEMRLLEVYCDLFQRQDIQLNDSFFDLGGHSLLAAKLASAVERLFGHRLPLATIFHAPSVAQLAERLGEDWAPAWSSLVPLQTMGSKPPLYLVHGWGGDVYGYLPLAKQLAPDQPVYGIRAVGLDGKERRHTTVEQMASHYVREIRSFQPEGAYRLAGYSMGGLIACEVAQQLIKAGQRVSLLALIDTEPFCQVQWHFYLKALGLRLADRWSFHLQRWLAVPRGERSDYIRQRWNVVRSWIKRNRSKPAAVTSTPSASAEPPKVPGFDDYYHAVASAYVFKKYPGPVDLFVCNNTPELSIPCWRVLARGGLTVHRLAWDHLALLGSEPAAAVATILRRVLAQQLG
jgi:amino acid adenylation domain-containing protein